MNDSYCFLQDAFSASFYISVRLKCILFHFKGNPSSESVQMQCKVTNKTKGKVVIK